MIYSFFCWQALECARTSILTFLEWTVQPGVVSQQEGCMFNSSRTFAKVPEWPDMKSPVTASVWKARHSQVWSGVSCVNYLNFPEGRRHWTISNALVHLCVCLGEVSIQVLFSYVCLPIEPLGSLNVLHRSSFSGVWITDLLQTCGLPSPFIPVDFWWTQV